MHNNKYGARAFKGVNGSMIDLEMNLNESIDFDFYDPGKKLSSVSVPMALGKQNSAHTTDSEAKLDCYKAKDYGNNPKSKLTKFKDDRLTNQKALMNCIAFEAENGDTKLEELYKDKNWTESNIRDDDNDSLSTDTTSDITDVTPRPSSSGCSSMSKLEAEREAKCQPSIQYRKNKPEKNRMDVQHKRSMNFLKEALDNLEIEELSIKSSNTSSERKYNLERKNMSFSKDELRKIERENHILLQKIEGHIKRPKQGVIPVYRPRLSSTAINRQKQQLKIEHDNMILLRKIKQVKGTTSTMTSLRRY